MNDITNLNNRSELIKLANETNLNKSDIVTNETNLNKSDIVKIDIVESTSKNESSSSTTIPPPPQLPQSIAINNLTYKNFILKLSKENSLNFGEILQLFNCAISQEQAWAVLYQCLFEFKILLDASLELVKDNLDLIELSLINFTKDGLLLMNFVNLENIDSENENSPDYGNFNI
jgi:hypothetical protein